MAIGIVSGYSNSHSVHLAYSMYPSIKTAMQYPVAVLRWGRGAVAPSNFGEAPKYFTPVFHSRPISPED